MADVYLEVQQGWGRRAKASWFASIGAGLIVTLCPCWLITNWIALEYYGGSLRLTARAALKQGLGEFVTHHVPRP